jgi:hypothetical protein
VFESKRLIKIFGSKRVEEIENGENDLLIYPILLG